MNRTEKNYKALVESLQSTETTIHEYEQFLGRLLKGEAGGLHLSLLMDKPKDEKSYLEKEQDAYEPRVDFGLSRMLFGSMRIEEPAVITTPAYPVAEEVATRICQMILSELHQKREEILRKLGVSLAAQTAQKKR